MLKLVLSLLVAAMLVVMTACGDDDGGGDDNGSGSPSESVAYVHLNPTNADGWEAGGFEAVSAMVEKYGLDLSEQVVTHDQAATRLRSLAADAGLIITHSSGFGAGVIEAAPELPDTWFIVFSDLGSTEGLENVAAWRINWSEFGYLAGGVACLAAKERGSNVIGHVNSQPLPSLARYGGGAEQATEDLGCEYLDRWTNSFTDTAKAKQAALSMIDEGAEVIIGSTDAGDQGTREAVIEEDKLTVANYSEQEYSLAPENTITAVIVNFGQAYDEIGELYTTDKLEPKIYPVDFEGDGIELLPLTHVSEKVQEQTTAMLEDIRSGEIRIDPNRTTEP